MYQVQHHIGYPNRIFIFLSKSTTTVIRYPARTRKITRLLRVIYSVFLLIRVLLSWFPNLDWGSNPILSGLSSITDPYLNLFRGLIPPLGGIDLSAFVAFLALNLVQSLLEQGKMLLASSGLG
jgi:YggT family protein